MEKGRYDTDGEDEGKRNVSESLKRGRPINRCRLTELVGDATKGSQHRDHHERKPGPYAHQDKREHGKIRVREPKDRLIDQAEACECAVDDSALVVEHPLPANVRNDWRHYPRNEDECSVDAADTHPLVEENAGQ